MRYELIIAVKENMLTEQQVDGKNLVDNTTVEILTQGPSQMLLECDATVANKINRLMVITKEAFEGK